MGLTPRQQREIDYHRAYAERKTAERLAPVAFDVIEDKKRRPQNAYWSAYDRVLAHDIAGKRMLVPGCGFGEDAIRLARLGAQVDGADISPEVLDVARRRCAEFGYGGVNFSIMPSEALSFPDRSFDFVFLNDILHHVDIAPAIAEIARILRPGGRVIGNELYTHSFVQTYIRKSWLVDKALYKPMRKFIYGDDAPYITADEHKIDEAEFAIVKGAFAEFDAEWFNIVVGRLLPDRISAASMIDRAVMKFLAGAGTLFAGRVVFEGVVR